MRLNIFKNITHIHLANDKFRHLLYEIENHNRELLHNIILYFIGVLIK